MSLSNFASISLEELRVLAPRIALYSVIGFGAVQAATFVTAKVSTLLGLNSTKTGG